MNYLGDFPTGATVYVPFHTFDSDGASVTISGLATTDIEIYKNGGTTQRSSDNGYTLLDTDGIDFDSLTGIHGFSIDLSDNSDAGFYAAGNEYMVVVSSITVDSQTVSFVAATFSIERSGGALELLKNATYGLSAIETLVDDLESRLTAARAGYLDNLNTGVTLADNAITSAKYDESTAYPLASADTGATEVARTGADGDTLEDISDEIAALNDPTAAAIADAVWDEASAGHTDAGKAGAQLWTDVDAILADTNELQTDDVPGLIGALNDPTAAEIRTEMDSNSTQLAAIVADTNELQTDDVPGLIGALNDPTAAAIADAVWDEAATGHTDAGKAGAQLWTDIDAILTDTNELQTDDVPGLIGALNDVSTAEVNAEVDTALADVNLDHLVGTAAPGIPPAGTYLDILADDGTATYDRTTDSLQAIRDRGDAAWTTGGGGSISDILNVQALVPNDIDLANTATVRIGLGLTNMLDDLPSTTEITPGTITIDRKAIGGTSWTNVVNAAACSEVAGLIYYDEVFDSGTGYAEGDSIRITFKSQKITVAANDYEITGTDGWIFQTSIRQTMRGTDSAALASVCTEARLAELDAANMPTDLSTIDTVVDAVKAVTDNLPNSGALTDIDTGVNAIEAKLPSKAYLAGSADADGGIDTTEAAVIQSECTDALNAYDPPTKAELDSGLAGLNDPTAAAVADAVWDEAATGHTDAGKAGAQLWTDIDAILTDTGTTLDGKLDTIDTNVDAILVDTGTTLDGKIDTIDTNVDSILADTGTDGVVLADGAITAAKIASDAITAAKIAADAITSSELATSAAQEIADEVLKRGISNVEDAADALSLAAIVLATLESSISGTTWTIRKSGGTTFATKTLTVDADADPVTGVT